MIDTLKLNIQDSAREKREIHTVNNNVYFVPKFGTFWSFNA